MPFGDPFGCSRCGRPFRRGFHGPVIPWWFDRWDGPGCCRGRRRWW